MSIFASPCFAISLATVYPSGVTARLRNDADERRCGFRLDLGEE